MAKKRKLFAPPKPASVNQESQTAIVSSNNTSEAERALQQAHRQEYLEIHKHYRDQEQNSYDSIDKAILTLSSSAFTVSLALVQFMPTTREQSWLVGAAWLCWILAMLLTLISFLSSQLAFRKQIEVLDEMYYPKNSSHSTTNIPDRVTLFLNWASAAAFIAGAGFMAIFVYFNLPA